MKYFPKRTFSLHEFAFYFMKNDKILPEILVFSSYSFKHMPNFVKDLYGRISRKIRQKVSLILVLSRLRSIRAIFSRACLSRARLLKCSLFFFSSVGPSL